MASSAPIGPKGSGPFGLSTIQKGFVPIEILRPWWDQKHGSLPDPDTIPAEPMEDIVLGYPAEARRNGAAAQVVVAIAVDLTGKVDDVYLISGDPPWSTYAEGELREVKFKPARLGGEAVPYYLVYAIEFVPVTTAREPK